MEWPLQDQGAGGASGQPFLFGTGRIGAGWVGIGIAGAAFAGVAASQLAIGNPVVLLAVGPLLAVFALACATTREVRVDPRAGEVIVTRRLPGLSWARRLRPGRFRSVTVRMEIFRPRHSASDGTLLGDQIHTHYTVFLQARRPLRLASFHTPLEPDEARSEAEALARALGARLGLRAEREAYATETLPDGTCISVPQPRSFRAPVPGGSAVQSTVRCKEEA